MYILPGDSIVVIDQNHRAEDQALDNVVSAFLRIEHDLVSHKATPENGPKLINVC